MRALYWIYDTSYVLSIVIMILVFFQGWPLSYQDAGIFVLLTSSVSAFSKWLLTYLESREHRSAVTFYFKTPKFRWRKLVGLFVVLLAITPPQSLVVIFLPFGILTTLEEVINVLIKKATNYTRFAFLEPPHLAYYGEDKKLIKMDDETLIVPDGNRLSFHKIKLDLSNLSSGTPQEFKEALEPYPRLKLKEYLRKR